MSARQRSLPCGAISASRHSLSSSRRQRSLTLSASCPSAKQSASTVSVSPLTRLTGKRPPPTAGLTRSITARARPAAAGLVWPGREESAVARSAIGALLQDHGGQWRQRQRERPGLAVRRQGHRVDATEIAPSGASVDRGIAVQDLLPTPCG